MITLHDKSFELFIPAQDIQNCVQHLAQKINADFESKQVVFLSILNGAFMFTADLLKHITIPCEISFVKLASYQGTKSTGEVKTLMGLDTDLLNKHVIIIEDIVDTGKTLHAFLPCLKPTGAAAVHICTFLTKPTALQYPLTLKYVGIEIEDRFVVGYGMDYDGLGRQLDALYVLANN